MRRTAFLLVALIQFSTVCGQLPPESQTFLTESLSTPRHWDPLSLDSTELLSQLTHFDYSSLWTEYDKDILAFAGDDYQRLRVKYLAVVKNAEDPTRYYVYGKRMVESDICPFMGEIKLIHIRMFSESERKREYERATAPHVDEWAIHRFSYPEYSLFAQYRFFENPNQAGTGFFEGILRTDFYVDSGKIVYDTLDFWSDGYCNNQYVGTLTIYAGGAPQKSYWGEWWIPLSGDFSVFEGAEWGPGRKYWDKGWDTYTKARYESDTTAQKEEQREWWKE